MERKLVNITALGQAADGFYQINDDLKSILVKYSKTQRYKGTENS